jgi:hypothetical protein
MKNVLKLISYVIASTISLSVWATTFKIENHLPQPNKYCKYSGNTVTLFYSGNQPTINPGGSLEISGDFSQKPYGLGIQINNWYWTAKKMPVQKGNPQNPDNSGAQFMINNSCDITSQTKPVFGLGIETYLIAQVASTNNKDGGCIITIKENSYTNAVTPTCCAPPGIGSDTCISSQWGQTANSQHWPPK